MKQKKSQKKYRKDLSHYFSESVIVTVCVCCLIAVLLVGICMKIFYHQTVTPILLFGLCLIICCVTVCLTGISLFIRTKSITRPITRVSDATVQIAKGDFKIRIPHITEKRKGYTYENELDELVENLNKMASELEGMDYMRKDFMSNVSHEVKTPVAAITGFSEILLDGNLTEEDQREYLTLVHQESLRLSDLCENMLRMSRLDHQEIIAVNDEIRLDEQIRKCVILLSEKWQMKNIEFVLDLPAVIIVSKKNLLMQVWMNLIDNAMKYSENNSKIEIELSGNESEISVSIRDHGIGISPEKQSKIFERFYQCEESHKKQGSGLGLSIVKRILELLSGTIRYESRCGEGTKVTVVLPLIYHV